jgi:hypothetical protein
MVDPSAAHDASRAASPATSWQPSPGSPESTADRCVAQIDTGAALLRVY